MMTPKKNFIFGMLMPLFVFAQNEAPVSFSFRAITWADRPLTELELSAHGDKLVINAPIDKRSEVYQYSGDGTIEVFQAVGGTPERPLAEISANPNWSEVLFFLLPNAKRSELKVLALDDSLSAFPANTVRILNLSGKRLAGVMGEQKIILENMADKQVEVTSQQGFMPIRFAKNSGMEERWVRFLSSAIEVRQGMRTLIVFYPGHSDDLKGGRDVTYKLFNDIPEASS